MHSSDISVHGRKPEKQIMYFVDYVKYLFLYRCCRISRENQGKRKSMCAYDLLCDLLMNSLRYRQLLDRHFQTAASVPQAS